MHAPQWLGRWFQRRQRRLAFSTVPASRRRHASRFIKPHVDPLELRLAPAAVTWTNPMGGDWDTPGNWSSGSIPGSGDDVTIPALGSGMSIMHSAGGDAANSVTSGTSIVLTGGSLAINGALQLNSGAALTLQGGGLANATVSGASNVVLTNAGGTLDGVTINGPLDVTADHAIATVVDGLALNGTATLGPYAQLDFSGSQTLGGNATVLFQNEYVNALIASTSGMTLTLGPNVLIHGGGSSLYAANVGYSYYFGGGGNTSLDNQGTVDADAGGGSLTLAAQGSGTVTNTGALTATNGGTLNVNGLAGNLGSASLSDSGSTLAVTGNYTVNQSVTVASGQTLSLGGAWNNAAASSLTVNGGTLNLGDQSSSSSNAWTNNGTISATNSAVNLGGVFSLTGLGTFSSSGNTVNVTGTLTNKGATLALGATSGSWNLAGGTIQSGTIAESAGSELAITNLGGTLDGVTVNGPLDLTASNANATVVDSLTLNGTATLGAYARLYFNGTQTLGGNASVVFQNQFANALTTSSSGTTLTLGPDVQIHGGGNSQYSGNVGYSNYWGGGSYTALINLGSINADTAGTSISVNAPPNETGTITNNGTLTAANGGTLNVIGLAGNVGTATLGGSGSSLALSGSNYTVNQALAVGSGQTLTLGGTWTLVPGKTITATAATLNLGDQASSSSNSWVNAGTISATNSTVNLGGLFTLADLGTFNSSSSPINVIGTLDNVSPGLTLNASTGSWNLAGGTILGGAINAIAGSELVITPSGGTLDGVTVNGPLDLTATNANANVVDGLTLNGTATLGAYARLYFNGTQTLGGNASVLFQDQFANALIVSSSGTTLTLGPNVLIHGGGNSQYSADVGYSPYWGGGNYTVLVNHATISGDAAGLSIAVNAPPTGTVTNGGTFMAQNGGTLNVIGLTGNVGTATLSDSGSSLSLSGSDYTVNQSLSVGSGQTLSLGGIWSNPAGSNLTVNGGTLDLGDQSSSSSNAWSNYGTISATNSTVNLGGLFTLAGMGTFNSSGNTNNVVGTLNNASPTLALNATTGSWNLAGGTILGGRINESAGSELFITSAGGTLDGVTVNGPLDLSATQANAVVVDGLTLNGTATLGPYARLYFDGTQTLGGNANVFFQNVGANALIANTSGMTLTLGPNVLIHGGGNNSVYAANVGSSPNWGGGSFTMLVNQGIINADTPGASITVNVPNDVSSTMTSTGTLAATSGTLNITGRGILANSGTIAAQNAGTVSIQQALQFSLAAQFSVSANSAVTLNGNLLAVTQHSTQFQPSGATTLDGGSVAAPILLEAMSADLGNAAAGFNSNAAYGSLVLSDNSVVQLVDLAHNSSGTGPESVYTQVLAVPSGSTLDLHGLNLYARVAQIDGTVNGGSVHVLAAGGPLAFNVPTPGDLLTTSQQDDWTFSGTAGQTVNVSVATGSGSTPAPLSPAVGFVTVLVLDSGSKLLATASNANSGDPAQLLNVSLPSNGTYHIQVQSSGGQTGNYLITLAQAALSITTTALANGDVGADYSKTLSATGGSGSYAFSSTGTLPTGLTLTSGGMLAGTPTMAGSYSFTVTATDALGVSASRNYTVTINSAPSLTTTALVNGDLNAAFTQTLNASGGSGSYIFSSADPLPAGLTLSSTGVLSGTPTATGTFLFAVTATDALGGADSRDYTVVIYPAATMLVISAPPSATAGTPFSLTVMVTDGSKQLAGAYHGVVTLSSSAGANIAPTSVTVNNGTATVLVTLTAAGPQTITAMATSLVSANAPVTVSPGALGQYLVKVMGPSTVQAGGSVLTSVQAADGYGNVITSGYNGPATVTANISPATAASSFPQTVTIPSTGLSFFNGVINKVGSYTISVAGGSFTGTASTPVTVTPGPAAGLAFAAQPANTATGVLLPTVTVQIQDTFGNVVTSDNSDTITVFVASGPGAVSPGSTTTLTANNGVASFNNLILIVPGTYKLGASLPGHFLATSAAFSIAPLQVVPGSFAGTPSGFSVQFNAPYLVNSMTPALYGTGFKSTATVTPSVTLTQTSGTPPAGFTLPYQVEGSVILNQATNSFTFLATNVVSASPAYAPTNSPTLADGTYLVDIRSSGPNGLQALNSGGNYLDGTNAGTPGHDFTATFSVSAADEAVIWVPATADGPGQPLSAPGQNHAGGGYPIYLDHMSGNVTSVQATLTYNPALLIVTPSSTATFTVTVPAPGTAVLQYSGSALPLGLQVPIGSLNARVPSGSAGNPEPYKAKDLLHLSNVQLNAGAVPVMTSDGLHLVAYVGDADGNGSYTSNDAVLITRALLNTDTGFAAYPLVDPVIVADTDGSGFIPADAALQTNEAGVGLAAPNLPTPPIPPGVVFQPISNNVDPTLSVVRNALSAGRDGTVAVSVNIDDAHPAGSTGLIEAHLALIYDPQQFTVSAADVHLGSLLAGGDWSVVPTIDPVTGQIGIALSSTTPITSTSGGSLVTIDFHVRPGEPGASASGPVTPPVANAPGSPALVASANPNGQYVATELEDAQGTFTLSLASTSAPQSALKAPVPFVPPAASSPPDMSGPGAAMLLPGIGTVIDRVFAVPASAFDKIDWLALGADLDSGYSDPMVPAGHKRR